MLAADDSRTALISKDPLLKAQTFARPKGGGISMTLSDIRVLLRT